MATKRQLSFQKMEILFLLRGVLVKICFSGFLLGVLFAAVSLWLPKGREHSLTAFAAAMLSGIFPLVSDSYDMLKDALFGGLCLQTNDPFTQTLGIFSWVYLLLGCC